MKSIVDEQSTVAVELLRQMMRIRLVEEAIASRYTVDWKMRCPTHLCVGQEAVPAAVGIALREDDLMVSAHRAHGHYLAKGGDLKAMLAEIYGKVTGCSRGKGGSMHLVDRRVGFMGSTAIVGGTIPVGVGLGLSIKLNQTDQISCIFLGDGATEEGVFYESVNFAVLKQLPVLFVCENNLYSVYSPLRVRQPTGRSIFRMVEGLGCCSDSGDGNNALEVYDKVNSASKRIRAGRGPQFLEFATYRWLEHCGPNYDNDIGYRTEDEFLAWKDRDPIVLQTKKLTAEGTVSTEEIEEMKRQLKAEIEDAFVFADNSDFPGPEDVFTDLYKN